ncbi:VOC family protein [Dyella soli]|uniref:VOC family protein n=1 Tax=Dyella soli TaxID=522319 RepID=A0A4R0YE40_9GAMM|nr:VOC family protein [Dyella soli]TCI06400.1 VOC family protein [Dyella soli]
MQVQAYLFFEGRCEEALAFYTKTIGAQVLMLKRYKEAPPNHEGPTQPPELAEKVMHASFRVGESVVMGSDGYSRGEPKFEGFSLSLTVASDDEAARVFKALVDGGEATMPLEKTFFSSSFGMLKDRFGVHWMVMAAP